MNDFGFEHYTDGFGFTSFSENTDESSGPYIPAVMDCLSCGICIGSCPTYRVKQEENHGPRGRVRLIERVLKNGETLSTDEVDALNACTLCKACETVCPSKMEFNELHRQTMEVIDPRPNRGIALRLLLDQVASRRSVQRLMSRLIHFHQRSGLSRLLEKMPFSFLKGDFQQLEKLLPVPHVSETVPAYTRAIAPGPHKKVALFTGCIANIFDTQTHNATIKLLTRLGHDVHVLEKQSCCGAIYDHNGDVERAKSCARNNREALAESGLDFFTFNSSGCGAFLNEYPALLDDDQSESQSDTDKLAIDVLELVSGSGRLGELEFKPLHSRVAVHEPCSQRNELKNQELVYELLAKVPGLEVIPLADNKMCCGAGGTRMVTHPELAIPMRDDKVKALEESEADILVSANLSCAMHLTRGNREADLEIKVIHPVTLLAQQLID